MRVLLLVVAASFMPLLAQARMAVKPMAKPQPAFKLPAQTTSILGASASMVNGFDGPTRSYINESLNSGSLSNNSVKDLREGYNLLSEATLQIADAGKVQGLAVALAESKSWEPAVRQRVVDFTASLVDGVNTPAEAKKLQEVEKNCRL